MNKSHKKVNHCLISYLHILVVYRTYYFISKILYSIIIFLKKVKFLHVICPSKIIFYFILCLQMVIDQSNVVGIPNFSPNYLLRPIQHLQEPEFDTQKLREHSISLSCLGLF